MCSGCVDAAKHVAVNSFHPWGIGTCIELAVLHHNISITILITQPYYLPTACIDKRYGDTWDLKTLTSKANQKCRDTKQ